FRGREPRSSSACRRGADRPRGRRFLADKTRPSRKRKTEPALTLPARTGLSGCSYNEAWARSPAWRMLLPFCPETVSKGEERKPPAAPFWRKPMTTDAGLPAAYDALVEDLLEQINLGRSYEELFDRIYDGLQGIVPYHRIAVALLLDPGDRLGLVSCR